MAETTKTTTARKTAKAVKLPLTSRKKMGAARGKSAIKAEVKKVREENEKAHERRTEACGKAAANASDLAASIIDQPEQRAAEKVDTKAADKALRTRKAARIAVTLAGLDWTKLPNTIAQDKAEIYAGMLASGEAVTPRAVENATGLNARQRCKVEKVLGTAGYKLHHERNPERVQGDRDTANRYWITKA